MKINQIAFSSLELMRSLKGNTKKGSLLHSIDFTTTKAGSRLLAERLTSPLTSIDKINKRLDLVQLFYDNSHLTSDIQSNLANCRDAQRALQRLSLNYGGPADLVDISTTLKTICKIKELLVKSSPEYFASNFSGFLDDLQPHEDLADTIIEAMGIEAPKRLSGPGFINKRSTRRLKELSNEYDKLISEKEDLEQELRRLYDIKSLKLLSTASLKHYVEVSPRDAAKVMESEDVTLIQTLKGKRRFQINRWTILSSKLEFTYEQIYEEEKAVFEETVNKVLAKTPSIMKSCRVLAQLDVASSFAVLAREKNYSRPILNNSGETKIIGGRHPVVEKSLHDKGRQFAKNDCLVGANGNVCVITGPNMGGKSTFLRQVAIVSIMAQTGGFVPADRAELGIIDGLFSRVGAADNLALDQSTFMVIMDEVGRGTSTTDGLSIAYATLHHLNQTIKCRSLFATHYHELTDMLNEELQDVACYHTTVQEDQAGNYSYVHVVRPGVMRQSHGLYVAQLAGLPKSVIELARHVKENLDTKPMPKPSVAYIPPPIPQPVDNTSSIKLSKIQRLFEDVDIMETTPGKALDLISKACKVLNTNTIHP
ncbi:MutS protein 1 [Basidiobolus ranarum]|uniref:MutS protein 1 n=1 Tax=Basidiobolus ranarum TaxID=34480 RepID=A0ABR2WW73_9FUNG